VERARFRRWKFGAKSASLAAIQVNSLSLEKHTCMDVGGSKSCPIEFMQNEWRSTREQAYIPG
jgi:hypothetical protein